MAEVLQFPGERAQTLAGPAQRRHRITTRRRLDQRIEVVERLRVCLDQQLSDALVVEVPRQILQASPDRARRTPGNARDRRNPVIARGPRSAHHKKASAALVEIRRQIRVTLAHRLFRQSSIDIKMVRATEESPAFIQSTSNSIVS